MAVTSSTNKASFSGNGVTTAFSLEVKCFSTDEVNVYTKTAGVQTEVTTGITKAAVSGDLDNGVTVTFTTAPATGTSVTLIREIDETQTLELEEGGNLPAGGLEDALDRCVMISQQIVEQNERSIIMPVSDSSAITYDVDTAENRANKALGFDSSGNVTELSLAAAGAVAVDTAKGLELTNNIIEVTVDAVTMSFNGSGELEVVDLPINVVKTQNIALAAVTTDNIASPTGVDTNVVTGTKGANGQLVGWNADGDAVDAGFSVTNDDDLGTSDTTIPTQGNVKAYVDALLPYLTTAVDELVDVTGLGWTAAWEDLDLSAYATDGAYEIRIRVWSTSQSPAVRIYFGNASYISDISTVTAHDSGLTFGVVGTNAGFETIVQTNASGIIKVYGNVTSANMRMRVISKRKIL